VSRLLHSASFTVLSTPMRRNGMVRAPASSNTRHGKLSEAWQWASVSKTLNSGTGQFWFHFRCGSFATRSCQQQVRSCSLCTESGSKFRAFDDTSTGYCGLMALPGT
jgi:hypothetical protein